MMKVDLHTHVRWCTRLQWAMGIMLAVIILAFYVVGYRPPIQRLESMQSAIQRDQIELSANESRTLLLPVVAAEVKQLREHVDEAKQLPSQQQLPQFLQEVTQLGQHASLHGFAVKPGTPTRGDLFDQLPVNLSFDGDYKNVHSFLCSTEEMKRLTRIGAISIKDEQGQPGQVQVQLSMNLFFAPN